MSEFQAYLQLGFHHITNIKSFDHILFIVALCAIYQLKDWRKVLILITAFTIGHSLTLVLSTIGALAFPKDVIEFLILASIFITAISNFFYKHKESFLDDEKPQHHRYVLALCFGLVHGLGFSSDLRNLLGNQTSILRPLFAFNIGIEIGQLLIVLLILFIAFVFNTLLRVKKHDWNITISGIVIGISLVLISQSNIF